MSKAKMNKWNAVMVEIKAVYAIEHTMPAVELIKLLKPLRERQDALRDK